MRLESVGLRAAALAAVALVATAVALAATQEGTTTKSPSHGPSAVGSWNLALAAPYPKARPARGACGVVIDDRAVGVGTPNLPCGVELFIRFKGRNVLTHVIDRGIQVPGRYFAVTRRLARAMGLRGSKPVKWRYAR